MRILLREQPMLYGIVWLKLVAAAYSDPRVPSNRDWTGSPIYRNLSILAVPEGNCSVAAPPSLQGMRPRSLFSV